MSNKELLHEHVVNLRDDLTTLSDFIFENPELLEIPKEVVSA